MDNKQFLELDNFLSNNKSSLIEDIEDIKAEYQKYNYNIFNSIEKYKYLFKKSIKNQIKNYKPLIVKVFRILMQKIFRFNRWHISTIYNKKYIIDILQYFEPYPKFNKALEVGCGLGDIIRNIDTKNKECLDYEKAVLNGCKFLANFRNRGCETISFEEFNFIKNNLSSSYDLIIMVNWMHQIEYKIFDAKMKNIFKNNLNSNGKIVFDVLIGSENRYNHTLDFLDSLDCEIEKLGTYAYPEYGYDRIVYVVTKR